MLLSAIVLTGLQLMFGIGTDNSQWSHAVRGGIIGGGIALGLGLLNYLVQRARLRWFVKPNNSSNI
jgi:hypothetical protein